MLTYFTARYTTSISTLVAIIGALLDSQITFCCMMRADKPQQNSEPDNNSDVDYIMPRVGYRYYSILYFIQRNNREHIKCNTFDVFILKKKSQFG